MFTNPIAAFVNLLKNQFIEQIHTLMNNQADWVSEIQGML